MIFLILSDSPGISGSRRINRKRLSPFSGEGMAEPFAGLGRPCGQRKTGFTLQICFMGAEIVSVILA